MRITLDITVCHLQQFSDFFTTCVFFRGTILSSHYKTSNVVLLFYTTLEVYTNFGMVSRSNRIPMAVLGWKSPIQKWQELETARFC